MGNQSFLLTFTSVVLIIVIIYANVQREEDAVHEENEHGFQNRIDSSTVPEVVCKSEVENEASAVYIAFTEFASKEDNEQYVQFVMKNICKGYHTLVLNIKAFNSKVLPEESMSTLFLEEILAENEIRRMESLAPYQIFFYIPAEHILDLVQMNRFLRQAAESVIFSRWKGLITGLIFDSSFLPIPNAIKKHNSYISSGRYSDSLGSPMGNVVQFMETFYAIFGNDMKMGLGVNHTDMCITISIKATTQFLSRIDLILYNGFVHGRNYGESEYSNWRYDNCQTTLYSKTFVRVTQVM